MEYGLLGQKLSHSYSPQIHREFGNYPYALFEVEPQDLSSFLTDKDFSGINVTIPYKKAVIPYCDTLSETAKKLGSVNTIIRDHDGNLLGHNTDYFGFRSMLNRSGLSVSGKKVLVLGSGGASVTVCAVLQEYNANTVVISRRGDNNYANLHLHNDAYAIVNTTPVGMYPNNGVSPVDLSVFPQLAGVLDVIYNPARTKLLMDAEAHGLITMNGLWMLVAQAKESAEWFTGQKLSDTMIEPVYQKLRAQMQNIILVGMPGSGKTTVGRLLSKLLSRTFLDTDCAIEERAGMSIPDIFAKYGEEHFRTLESEVLSDIGKQSNLIIATGGGCVTRTVNYSYLHQNGTIYWLQRDVGELSTEGRPLSQQNNLDDMYRIRKPMYTAFADHTISNDSQPEYTAAQILALEEIQ